MSGWGQVDSLNPAAREFHDVLGTGSGERYLGRGCSLLNRETVQEIRPHHA
jgi:hypothetical protein